MRIGQLAERTGVSTSRIRFYERQGLLPKPARRASGYRDYDDRALAVVVFVGRARALGFGISAIVAHLSLPDDGSRKARLVEHLESRLDDVERQIQTLADKRRTLQDLVLEVRSQARDLS